MSPLNLVEICQAVGGRLLPGGDGVPSSVLVESVCTDTRAMSPRSLFIALKGDTFDGNRFVAKAAEGGAIAAIVDVEPTERLPAMHYIVVPNGRIAMGQLAAHVRQQFQGKVIGVAGSNGKTSTKHLIGASLEVSLKGSISPKSFNNDIGVPLAIFPAAPTDDYLVLEMGTNHHGEIRVLTLIARPDIAVITNCGPEHLEGLFDLAGVRRENTSIIQGMSPMGSLIINGDDPDLVAAVQSYPGKITTFGFKPANDLRASDVQCKQSGTTFKLHGRSTDKPAEVFVPLLGEHTAANALAAIAVGRKMGLRDEAIFQGLAIARGAEMRLQLSLARGITVLNDAYNANPASMKAGMQTLMALPTSGRRVAVLGDMLELGETTEHYHAELGELAGTMKPDLLVVVGSQASKLAEAARKAGLPTQHILQYADSQSAAAAVPAMLKENDLVLLKGSRGVRLELIAQAIERGQQ